MSFDNWIKQNKSKVEKEARLIASMYITKEDNKQLLNTLMRLEKDLATQNDIQERNIKDLGSSYVNKISLARIVNIKQEIKETKKKIKNLSY